MFSPAVSDEWWRNAVVYCVDVETFMDSDGDGVGDFAGLIQRIPYLAGLGVTCLWLLPFYPTPNRDDGYDVSDYYGVDPRLGTLGDFVELVRTARDRGIRIVCDLVVNHTSVDHPWFQAARSSRDSRLRDWYVWSDTAEPERKVIFPDREESVWTWDEQAGQYYLHRFYSSQPDLNVANPAVRDEIHRIMGFWLELGVAGFRIDAAPYLIGGTGIENEMPQDPHEILERMRGFLARRRGDAVMFGEVNLDPGEREKFFGDAGDEMNGLFNFILSGAIFVAMARGEATPLAEHLRATPVPPRACQWLNFVRNHDELNLSRLSQAERDTVMDAFAPEEEMRIFGRGIRRRLPPMVDGDRRRIELAYSLLLSLPGTPVLLYGEEIGMGEDLAVQGRRSVRTAMQWTAGANGGFSTCEASERPVPVLSGGRFGYEQVNVADQRRRTGSLLSRMEQAIRVRKECPEFGWGRWTVLDAGDRRLLAHRCDWLGGTVIAVHNLASDAVRASLDLADGDFADVLDVLGSEDWEPLAPAGGDFEVPAYGYRWLRARGTGSELPL